MIKKSLLIAGLGLAIGQGDALADGHDDTEIGIWGGYHFFGDTNELGTGNGPDLDSELNDGPIFGIRLAKYFVAGLGIEGELGFGFTGRDDDNAFTMQDESTRFIAWRAHLIWQFGTARIRPFILVGGGAQTLQGAQARTVTNSNGGALTDDTDVTGHAGVGVKLGFGHNWGLRLDARYILVPSTDGDGVTNDWEGLAGFYRSFGDYTPAPPAAPADADGDGIADADDQCPNEAEDLDGIDDTDGCPDADVAKDSDGDGVADSDDQCPSEPEDKDGFEDDNGCPDPDNDADGLADADDKCPTEAEDQNGYEDDDGCPDASKDDDGDGVANVADKCPDEAENVNGFEDGDGCKDEIPKKVAKFVGTIKGIKFASGSAKIRGTTRRTLNQAVKTLNQYPSIGIQVIGHTDDRGDHDSNVELSQQRADAVRAYIIDKGIAQERITSIGMGPDEPLVPNTTKKNRAQNRRTEFKLAQ